MRLLGKKPQTKTSEQSHGSIREPNRPIYRAHGIVVLKQTKSQTNGPEYVYKCVMCQKGYDDVKSLFSHMSASPMCQKDYILPEMESVDQPTPTASSPPNTSGRVQTSEPVIKKKTRKSKKTIARFVQFQRTKRPIHKRKSAYPRQSPKSAQVFTEIWTKAARARNDFKVKCQPCSKFFNSTDSLSMHMRTHYVDSSVREKALKCPTCLGEFLDEWVQSVHLQNNQCQKRCSKCVQGFDNMASLTRHLACHSLNNIVTSPCP